MIAGLEILNLHAQGGMAEVYRARGRAADGTDYIYAVKRMLPEYMHDPVVRKMFIEESRIAACLVHPNVVRVYDLAYGDNDEVFIVMEFLEGKDLSEAIEQSTTAKKPLPIWFALHVAREVCRALHYVTTEATDKHGRVLGLIHRDVSPHNIFLCFNGLVKLTDFGVAKVLESDVKTQLGITKGKLGYMSPEQLMGAPLDFRSDLYNVGILLFETITGRSLFAGASHPEFLQAMVRGVVPPIPPELQVPPELESLIRRALDRDRTNRPSTPGAFERELAEIAERYGLTAQSGHIALQMRELFGAPPPPAPPPVMAPRKLRTMMVGADGQGASVQPVPSKTSARPEKRPASRVVELSSEPLRRPGPGVPHETPASPFGEDELATLRQAHAERPERPAGSPEQRRPATVARGNARPLESPPTDRAPPPVDVSFPSEATAEVGMVALLGNDKVTSMTEELPNVRVRQEQPRGEALPLAPPPRPATVQIGGGATGVRSKRVVPLDEPKR